MFARYKRHHDASRSFLTSLLSQEASERWHDNPYIGFPIERGLLYALQQTMAAHHEQPVQIQSTAEFATLARVVFSDSYLDHLKTCASHFDRIAAESTYSVSDVFLSTRSFQEWVSCIGMAMACTAEKAADAEMGATREPNTQETASTAAAAATAATAAGAGSSGRAHDVSGSREPLLAVLPDAPHRERAEGCPIIDIHLAGRTIKAAWMAHPLTRAMEEEAVAPVHRNALWRPENASMAVYHGTLAPARHGKPGTVMNEFAVNLASFHNARRLLHGHVSINQMVPLHSSLPVVWTSFSPLRSFLWTIFQADVLTNIPSSHAVQALSTIYTCPRPPSHDHTGVRLIRFCPSSASGLSTFVLPDGSQDDWAAQVDQQTRTVPWDTVTDDPAAAIWHRFDRFHGQPAGTRWPEVLHCREGRLQAPMLTAFTRQLWRTVWWGRGIDVLHKSRHSAMSIMLAITEPTEPKTDEPIDTSAKRDGRQF